MSAAAKFPGIPQDPKAEEQSEEQRLRQARKLETVGRLAGGVAHDFNNLLTGVLLYCDLLMAGLEQGNRARKYAEEIRTPEFGEGLDGVLRNRVRDVRGLEGLGL